MILLIKKTMPYLIIVALISFVVGWIFQFTNTFLTEQNINGITIYTFDTQNYLTGLANAKNTSALDFNGILPPDNTSDVLHTLITVLNWLYFPINFILYLVRWLAWIILMALALIGWNMQKENGEYISTLALTLNWCLEKLFIPYITI